MGKDTNKPSKKSAAKKSTTTSGKSAGVGRGQHLTFANYVWFVTKAQEITAKKRAGVPDDTDDQLASKVQAAWQSLHQKDGRSALATVDIIKEKLALAREGKLQKPISKKPMGRPPKAVGAKIPKSSGNGRGRPLGEKGKKKRDRKQVAEETQRRKEAYEEEQRPIREALAAQHTAIISAGKEAIAAVDIFMDNHRFFLPSHEDSATALYLQMSNALQRLDDDRANTESSQLSVSLEEKRDAFIEKAVHAEYPFALEHQKNVTQRLNRSQLQPVFPRITGSDSSGKNPAAPRPGSKNILLSHMGNVALRSHADARVKTMVVNLKKLMAQYDLAQQKSQTDYKPPTDEEVQAYEANIKAISTSLLGAKKDGRNGKNKAQDTTPSSSSSSSCNSSSGSSSSASSSNHGSRSVISPTSVITDERKELDANIADTLERLVLLYQRRHAMDQNVATAPVPMSNASSLSSNAAVNTSASSVVPKTAALLIVTPPEPPGGGHVGTFAAFCEPYPLELQQLHRAMHGLVAGHDATRTVRRECATCVQYE